MSAVAGRSVGARLCAKLVLGACLSLWTTAAFADICDRTPEIYQAIVAAVAGKSHCSGITSTDLAGVEELVDEGFQSSLKSGDLDGLTGLQLLLLSTSADESPFSSLPADIFDDLTALDRLSLNTPSMSSLPDEVFDELTNLTKLHLEMPLASLNGDVFSELDDLERLRLWLDMEGTLPSGVFDGLTSLTELDLSPYRWRYVDDGTFSAAHPDNGDGLTSLRADVFDDLSALEDLDLFGFARLTELPDGVFDNLTSLRTMRVGWTGLTSLASGVFDDLTALERLWLYHNQLQTLPDDVFEPLLPSLKTLDLGGNPGTPTFRPVALAGDDREVAPGAMVQLDGSARGAWGTKVHTYVWNQTGGAPVTLSDTATSTPTFTAPLSTTTLSFELTVTARGCRGWCGSVDTTWGYPGDPSGTDTVEVGVKGLSLSVAPTRIYENGGIATVTLTADTTFDTAQTVALTLAGTATEGTDYAIDSKSLTIGVGETSVAATITATMDEIADGDETITITATSGGETIGSMATVTISEAEPELTLSVKPTVIHEGGGTATVTVATDTVFTSAQVVALALGGSATEGTDYGIDSKSLTLGAGATSVTATITATADILADDNETITVTATSGGQTIGSPATVTITETAPGLTLSVDDASIAEAAGTATVTVRTGPTFVDDQVIALALSGTATRTADYTIGSTSLTLAAGEQSVATIVIAVQDRIDDDAETVVVTASSGGDSIGSETVTITDDDDAPAPSLDVSSATVNEGGTVTVTVTTGTGSTFASPQTITLSLAGTATVVDDYTIGATQLVLPAGTGTAASSVTTTVTAVQDGIDDGGETVTVTATRGGQTIGSPATVTINETNLAVGTPTITVPNVYRVPAVLTADTEGITDADGLTGATWQYEWLRMDPDGTNEMSIMTTATSTSTVTYRLTSADVGKRIKVRVSFTDDGGNPEGPLDSAAVPATGMVAAAAPCPAPTYTGGATQVWTGTVVVGDLVFRDVLYWHGFKDFDGVAGSFRGGPYTPPRQPGDRRDPPPQRVRAALVHATDWSNYTVGDLTFKFSQNQRWQRDKLTLYVCDRAYPLREMDRFDTNGFTWRDDLDWSDQAERTLYLDSDFAAPTLASASVDGASLVMTFSETLDATSVPADSAFTVKVDGAVRSTASSTPLVIDGMTGTLTLATEVASGEAVTVSYAVPTSSVRLRDPAKNDTAAFTDQTVTTTAGDPELTIAVDDYGIAEAAGTATATVSASAAFADDQVIALTLSGTATRTADYTIGSTSLTLTAGATSVTTTVTAVDDRIDEEAETVVVAASSGGDSIGSETVTITDDDDAPVLVLDVAPRSIAEAGGTATATVTTGTGATFATDRTITLALGGTATETEDYTIGTTELILPAGTGMEAAATSTVITAVDDGFFEGPDAEHITVSGSLDGTPFDAMVVVTIAEDEDPPKLTLTVGADSIPENGGSTTVTANVAPPTADAFTVTFAVTPDASATTADYDLSGSLGFEARSTAPTGMVTVVANDNRVSTGDRTLSVTATSSETYFQPTDPVTLTLVEDDPRPAPVLRVAGSPIAEAGGTATVTVTTAEGSTWPDARTVVLTLTGSAGEDDDYGIVSKSLVLPAGSGMDASTATTTVTAIDDIVDDDGDAVLIDAAIGADAVGTRQSIAITDDDAAPTVTVDVSESSIAEDEGVSTVTVTTDTGASTFATDESIELTLSGTAGHGDDYTITSTTLTLPAGVGTAHSTVTASVTALDDIIDEADETILIDAARGGSGVGTRQTIEVLDDDDSPVLEFRTDAAQIGENGGTATLTVSTGTGSTYETAQTVTVSATDGTAVRNRDYRMGTTTLTLPAGDGLGESTVATTVTGLDDGHYEGGVDKTFTVSAAHGTEAIGEPLTIGVRDDEAPSQAVLVLRPATISEDSERDSGASLVSATVSPPAEVGFWLKVAVDGPADRFTWRAPHLAEGRFGYIEFEADATASVPRGDFFRIWGIDDEHDRDDVEVTLTAEVIGYDPDEFRDLPNPLPGIVVPTAARLTVQDDDVAATTVALSVDVDEVAEDAGATTVTVTGTLSGPTPDAAVSATLSVGSGTGAAGATVGSDFATVADFGLSIPVGDTSATATFTLTPIEDTIDEPRETLLVSGTTTDAEVGVAGTTIAITDNDAAPSLVLSVDPAAIGEAGGASTVTVTTGSGSTFRTGRIVTLALSGTATRGSDYTIGATSLALPAGAGTQASQVATTITALDDDGADPRERIVIDGSVDGSTFGTTRTVTIVDDEAPPVVTLVLTPARLHEGGSSTVSARVTPVSERAFDVTVSVAAETLDDAGGFTLDGSTLRFAVGASRSSGAVTITATDNDRQEDDRTARVSGAVSLAELDDPQDVVLTIVDDALDSRPPIKGTTPLFESAGHASRQGFVRVINHSDEAGEILVEGIDGGGMRAGPVPLAIGAGVATHFNSDDLQAGNAAKGLPEGLGPPGEGAWRLELSTLLDIEVLSYMRTRDGFVTSLHDTAPATAGLHRAVFLNPGSNYEQVSRLRLINPGTQDARVTVTGTDDTGATSAEVVLAVPAGTSREWTAVELESGTGAEGALGDGQGKWRLQLSSDAAVLALSLIESPTGHLTNLSTLPRTPGRSEDSHLVPLFPSASDALGRQGFARVANGAADAAEVRIEAFDDSDWDYEVPVLTVGARAAAAFNSDDLELGNADKGLAGSTGAGVGDWWLELSGAADIGVGAYVRTQDGFLTSMHDVAPAWQDGYRVVFFNPGSNVNQVSVLWLVNQGQMDAEATITGVDDRGDTPGTAVRLVVPAGGARRLTSAELESGGSAVIDSGALGDGYGKWRLHVESEQRLVVMSLLENPTGHLTNLSTAKRREATEAGAGGGPQ